MQFLTIAATALFSGMALAAPATANTVASRQNYPSIPVTFNGAADASFTIVVTGNAQPVPIENPLSITSISMEGRASFWCTSYGIDGSVTQLVASEQDVPVGPPQTQVSIVCGAPPY
ncbi:hypothetical protein GQ53DRAFT_754770 [Thozetella sp. PMI_491]|nr:hypothetical protein GQ53DRAFT_754770 [Thozetella sp. PMI_491]